MRQFEEKTVRRAMRRHIFAGFLILILLIGGIGGWSALASISGAVIAPGTVTVKSNKKRVQHADGGIVRSIHVQEGAVVKSGDVLFRLDDTRVRAELDIMRNRLFEGLVKRKRLIAERDGQSAFLITPEILALAKNDKHLTSATTVQKNLIRTRKDMRINQKNQLMERIGQLNDEIAGLNKQRMAKEEESGILVTEIEDLNSLKERGLAPVARLNALRREKADVDYELGQLIAQIARARGQISESKLKISEIEERYRNNTLTQLEEIEGKISELQERKLALEDRLNRLEIRAPKAGQIHELNIHTVGAVISAGELLAFVVPNADELLIEAKVRPTDIDEVHTGMNTKVNFTSFNLRTTPSLSGKVIFVSPDQSINERTNEAYFKVRIKLDEGEEEKLGGQVIVAGMPAEVMIKSGERTVLSYLVKPLTDQINRTFREQ